MQNPLYKFLAHTGSSSKSSWIGVMSAARSPASTFWQSAWREVDEHGQSMFGCFGKRSNSTCFTLSYWDRFSCSVMWCFCLSQFPRQRFRFRWLFDRHLLSIADVVGDASDALCWSVLEFSENCFPSHPENIVLFGSRVHIRLFCYRIRTVGDLQIYSLILLLPAVILLGIRLWTGLWKVTGSSALYMYTIRLIVWMIHCNVLCPAHLSSAECFKSTFGTISWRCLHTLSST